MQWELLPEMVEYVFSFRLAPGYLFDLASPPLGEKVHVGNEFSRVENTKKGAPVQ